MEGNMPQGEAGGASNQGQSNNGGQTEVGGGASNQSQQNGQNQSGATGDASNMKAETKNLLGQLEAVLDEYMVTKAPFALPDGLKEFLVKVSPYLVIIFAVLTLPLIFAVLGFSTALAPLGMMGGYGLGYGWGFSMIVSLIVAALTLVLYVMAVPGLFKRTHGAWHLLFYASIVSLIGSIFSFNIIGGIIGAVIGWYILFQLKSKYVN